MMSEKTAEALVYHQCTVVAGCCSHRLSSCIGAWKESLAGRRVRGLWRNWTSYALGIDTRYETRDCDLAVYLTQLPYNGPLLRYWKHEYKGVVVIDSNQSKKMWSVHSLHSLWKLSVPNPVLPTRVYRVRRLKRQKKSQSPPPRSPDSRTVH